MFGAAGIFADDDVMFGLVDDGHIYLKTDYLKTDEFTRKAFDAEGVKPFVFTTKDGPFVTSYRELPERLYDKDELARWARRAYDIALRSPAARKKQRAKAKSGARFVQNIASNDHRAGFSRRSRTAPGVLSSHAATWLPPSGGHEDSRHHRCSNRYHRLPRVNSGERLKVSWNCLWRWARNRLVRSNNPPAPEAETRTNPALPPFRGMRGPRRPPKPK